jgi:hypothetical protein
LAVSKRINFLSQKRYTAASDGGRFLLSYPIPAASLIFPHFLCCFLAILLNTY